MCFQPGMEEELEMQKVSEEIIGRCKLAGGQGLPRVVLGSSRRGWKSGKKCGLLIDLMQCHRGGI